MSSTRASIGLAHMQLTPHVSTVLLSSALTHRIRPISGSLVAVSTSSEQMVMKCASMTSQRLRALPAGAAGRDESKKLGDQRVGYRLPRRELPLPEFENDGRRPIFVDARQVKKVCVNGHSE